MGHHSRSATMSSFLTRGRSPARSDRRQLLRWRQRDARRTTSRRRRLMDRPERHDRRADVEPNTVWRAARSERRAVKARDGSRSTSDCPRGASSAASTARTANSHGRCRTRTALRRFLLDQGARLRVLCAFLDADRVGRCGWVDVDTSDPDPSACGQPATRSRRGTGRARSMSMASRPSPIGALADGGSGSTTPAGSAGSESVLPVHGRRREPRRGRFLRSRVSQAPVLDRSDRRVARPQQRPGDFPTATAGRCGTPGGAAGTDQVRSPRLATRYGTCDHADGMEWPHSGVICLEPRDDELGFGRPGILRRDGHPAHVVRTPRTLGRLRARLRDLDRRPRLGTPRRRAHLQRGRRRLGLGDGGALQPARDRHGTYLFYNGNGYGATGFGVAIAEDP